MTSMAIYPRTTRSGHLARSVTVGNNLLPPPVGMPMVIARDQLYYWSAKWQADEAEAADELARGEGRTFGTATEAIRWLLSDD
ncbi:MAG: hypothetical protein M3083_23570 [Actinomycetota bacterium]|nr:hypothetical protein [Actinomycetota bacterium]